MNLWQALVLGLLQGLTEFLPISSSGHLVLGQYFLHIDKTHFEAPVFEVAVHLGTLLSVFVYFRKDIWNVLHDFFLGGEGRRIGLMILLGTVPTVIIGFAFKDLFDALFQSPLPVAFALLVTAALLIVAERIKVGDRQLTGIRWLDALIIGTVQGIAIIPGISRSGSTIATGLITGMSRDAAARYSFLLSIPAIMGAAVLHVKDFMEMSSSTISPVNMFLAAIMAAISGYAAIGILMAVLKKQKLFIFAAYCAVVGIAVLVMLMVG